MKTITNIGAPSVSQLPDSESPTMTFKFSEEAPLAESLVILIQKRHINDGVSFLCGLVDTKQPMGESVTLFSREQAKQILGFSADIPGEEPYFGPFNAIQADAFLKLVQDVNAVRHFNFEAERSEKILSESLKPGIKTDSRHRFGPT
jgi:hypothetical protein